MTHDQQLLKLYTFLHTERNNMLLAIQEQIDSFFEQVTKDPKFFVDVMNGAEEPCMPVRLCIDRNNDSFHWSFKTGDASYDQRHSEYCGASGFTTNSDPREILDYLIEDLLQ